MIFPAGGGNSIISYRINLHPPSVLLINKKTSHSVALFSFLKWKNSSNYEVLPKCGQKGNVFQ